MQGLPFDTLNNQEEWKQVLRRIQTLRPSQRNRWRPAVEIKMKVEMGKKRSHALDSVTAR